MWGKTNRGIMVEDKYVYSDKQQMKRVKARRCPLCGFDKENLHPMIIKISEQSWIKLNEISEYDVGFKLRNTSYHDPKINKTVDDFNLRVIDGMCYEVNLDMCLECIDKVGYRHKFKGKHIQKLYATAQI